MPLYTFQCDACDEQFEEFCTSKDIGKAVIPCSACGAKKAKRTYHGRRGVAVVQNSLDYDKHMCVRIKSDRWPKDKYGRPVVSSRTDERAVLRQVNIESNGASNPISPYDH
jgi:putative FmdB family regulatory protein